MFKRVFFKPQAIFFFTVLSLLMAAAHILPHKAQGSSTQAPDDIRKRRGLRSTGVTHPAHRAAQVPSSSCPGEPAAAARAARTVGATTPPLPSAEQKHEKKEI